MKFWKKRWQDELDAVIPALSEEVRNAPIPAPECVENVKFKETVSPTPWYMQLFSTPRRIASCLSACVLGLVAVGASLYFAMRPDAPLTAEAEVISVEVNPQAVFSVDKDGIVTAVVAANDDADVVLSENRYLEMAGKTVEKAVEIFVDYTAQLGYLDFETPDAVRITSCAEDGYLAEVGAALKTYFQEKGAYVAVAEETVTLEAFCQRVNMEICDTVEMLKDSVERIPALCFEREADGKVGEELQLVYRENVPLDNVKDIFLFAVTEGVDKIEDFEAIDALADEIRGHEDNPGVLLKDYWSIKEKQIPATMSALMEEMEEKLLAYERDHGMKIQDALDLAAERAKCSVSALQTLTEAMLNYSLELFEQNFTMIASILNSIGIDTSVSELLYTVPETVEEYIEKMGEYTEEGFENLQKKNMDKYQLVREAITASDYDEYVNGLIKQYGSLSAYFERN